MSTTPYRHARESIIRLCQQVLAYNRFIDRLLPLLREAVPYDRAVVLMVDPETVMATGGVVDGFPSAACTPFRENELREPELIEFSTLPASGEAAALSEAANGALKRSLRYRTIYQEMNVADELRASFISDNTCWGIAAFLRGEQQGPFKPTEVSFVREIGPHVAEGLRRTILCDLGESGSTGPGTMIFGRDGYVEMMTPEAEFWLEALELQAGGETITPMTMVLTAVADRARRLKAGQSSEPARLRARTRTGHWLTLHASCLHGPGLDMERVAVIIEPSRTSDLATLLLEAYDLTRREREVLALLSHGQATKEIARNLNISVHTTRDHLKVIFDKFNVRSRGELLSRIFWQHARQRLSARIEHSHPGS